MAVRSDCGCTGQAQAVSPFVGLSRAYSQSFTLTAVSLDTHNVSSTFFSVTTFLILT